MDTIATEESKTSTEDSRYALKRFVMREYSQGVGGYGAVILCDGRPMTIEQILARLQTLEDVRAVIYDAPEINPNNYDHDQVFCLDASMCGAWSLIEADA